MKILHHASVRSFLAQAEPFLLANEVETFLVLGIAAEMPPRPPTGTLLFVVADANGQVVGCGIRQEPIPLILTRLPASTIPPLVSDLLARGVELSAVNAPKETSEPFAELWAARAAVSSEPGFCQRAFQLERVSRGLEAGSGRLRRAGHDDFERVSLWIQAFNAEVDMHLGDPEALAEGKIAQGAIFLWDDPRPVTMAAWAGPTANGIRINLVYTPPEWRGHGYATACVARLSQHLLDKGYRYCFLFTDLANPTSNKIYQRIGYRPIFDVNEFRFVSAAG